MIILERDSSEWDKCVITVRHIVCTLIWLFSSRRKVVNDAKKLRDLFTASRSARCFCRFPVPVILFNKKVMCYTYTD